MTARKVCFVTGMHRSGTSHLAGRLQATGLAFPGDMLPPNADNPKGYWEARDAVTLNNDILAAMGLDWRSPGPISAEQLETAFESFLPRVRGCLGQLASQAGVADFGIKDPRFCRLLPIWYRAAVESGLSVSVAASIREPVEIAASLFHRTRSPKFRPAAVEVPSDAILLSLRYMLDLERHSRGLVRRFISYPEIRHCVYTDNLFLEPCATTASLPDPGARSWRQIAGDVAKLLGGGAEKGRAEWLDEVRGLFDDAMPPAQSPCGFQSAAALAAERADAYVQSPGRRGASGLKVAFISGAPESRGHVYRVENRIFSVLGENIAVLRIDPENWSSEDVVRHADVIIVFRKEMDAWLEQVFLKARKESIPTVFDIDDLLIDESMMSPDVFRYLEGKPRAFVSEWTNTVRRYRLAAAAADTCWVTTEPLAQHMRAVNPRVRVLKNGLSDASRRIAGRVRAMREARPGSGVVLGYASGTPTHERDFEMLVEPLFQVMNLKPDIRLRVTGKLSDAALLPLAQFADRIERRPVVDYWELPLELAAVDINLAPLEVFNPFCECKSELKVFESAILGIPTVASATQPYRSAILQGESGFAVTTPAEWQEALLALSADKGLRERSGMVAQEFCERRFGPDQQRADFLDCLAEAARRDVEVTP